MRTVLTGMLHCVFFFAAVLLFLRLWPLALLGLLIGLPIYGIVWLFEYIRERIRK